MSEDAGDAERRIRDGRRRGEASVSERAWRRSSDAMGGGGGLEWQPVLFFVER